MVKIDLKDAYFTIPIGDCSRKFLEQIHVEPKEISVLLPSFWSIISPLGIHKGIKTSDCISPYARFAHSCIIIWIIFS